MRMSRIVIVSFSALLGFPTLTHRQHGFQEIKDLLNAKNVLWLSLQLLPETYLLLSKKNSETDYYKYMWVFTWNFRYSCRI